ncbi:MAG: hypothetical protein IJY21_02740 [Clostridia bacterium]|nr:hypothetical protein [Clostridia bacterium]
MRKIAKKTALFLSLTALVTTTAAFHSAQKSSSQTAYAQTVQTVQTVQTSQNTATDETALISPSTYQQYLSLTNPMDVAASSDYMAIADNNLIYVYDVADGEYRKYEHTFNQADLTKNNIMQVQFYKDVLYFLDGTYLYRLDPETLQISDVSITEHYPKFPCSSFLIVNDVLYYTQVQYQQADVSYITLDGTKADTLDNVPGKPTIAFWGGELYYTEAAKYLRKVDPQTKADDLVAYFPDDLVSMQIQDNVFICTTLSGDFYAYNLAELALEENAERVTPLAHYQEDYSSLALLGNYAYAVNGTSVCQYSIEKSEFTDFEICNASDSIHRFNGGTETLLSHEKLFIADNGNHRISVYDTKQENFADPIALDFSPKYLAGDEHTLLAADGEKAVVYAITAENYGEPIATFDDFNGTLVGATNVYGKYYFVTDGNYYYVASQTTNENNAIGWTVSEYSKASTRYARLLTSDVYGYLYVASGNSVYRFSEESFLAPTLDDAPPYAALPIGTEKILIDYNGDVYALAGGKLQKASASEPYALNDPLVYSESATVSSFTFGIEENVTYVLYAENYLAKTGILNLPTVKNIPVNGVDEQIFDNSTATVDLVKLRGAAMLIDFNLDELSGADVFPYVDYSRRETPLTALKIGQTADNKHAILAFYDTETRAYRSCLALTSDCSALTDEEQAAYYKTYPTAQTMYASNDIPVYKFPHLSGLPTVTTLTRNTQISVLGEINDLDYSYYLVQYTDGENVTHTGYVPKAYVIEFDPTPPTPETETYGAKSADKDGIRRLAFLLLGGAAILILINVLIFRAMRPKNDD